MFLLSSLVIWHGILWILTSVSAKQCDPANYICSGRCPDIPPTIHLSHGKPVCRKDSVTSACVCWLHSNTSQQVNSLFLCEAWINGTEAQVLCQPPTHCFPPDNEPTCLVIPICDCLFLNDEKSVDQESSNWKLVKAHVQTAEHSKKYPSDVREFSLKHLLFLLGFVIAPLFCWCLLNFVNENRCKRKTSRETTLSEERRAIERAVSQETPDSSQPTDPLMNGNDCSPSDPQYILVCASDGANSSDMAVHPSAPPLRPCTKSESPPSYREAVNNDSEQDDDGGPPPSYEDAVRNSGSTVPWTNCQTFFVIHSGPHQSV